MPSKDFTINIILTKGLAELKDAIKCFKKETEQANLKNIFKFQVEPVYNQIENIHFHYFKILNLILKSIKTHNVPSKYESDWLIQAKRGSLKDADADKLRLMRSSNLPDYMSYVVRETESFREEVLNYLILLIDLFNDKNFSYFSRKLELTNRIFDEEELSKKMYDYHKEVYYEDQGVIDFLTVLTRVSNKLLETWNLIGLHRYHIKNLINE